MAHKNTYLIKTLEEVKFFADILLKDFPQMRIFCFYGDLGAGKTTICREIIKNLTNVTSVTSPTFNIVSNYHGNENLVFHYDLYRLKDETEIFEIGLLENLNHGYSFIEWPQIAENLLKNTSRLNLHIHIISEEIREIIVNDRLD